MDRKLRRSGDGARIAGMLELDDLGILGGVDKNVFGEYDLYADYTMAGASRGKHTRYYCSW